VRVPYLLSQEQALGRQDGEAVSGAVFHRGVGDGLAVDALQRAKESLTLEPSAAACLSAARTERWPRAPRLEGRVEQRVE